MRRRLPVAVTALAVAIAGLAVVLGQSPGTHPPPVVAFVSPSPGPSTPGSAAATVAPSVAPSSPAGPTSPPTVPTATAALGQSLQASLDRLRKKAGIPGVSATVMFPDGTSWTGVSGLADVKSGRKVAPDTAFAVGSVSKTFLAALVLELASEGKLDLGGSVAKYLPTIRIDARVTVRQLLDHTSGLFDFFFSPGIDRALQSNRTAEWTPTKTLTFVRKPYFRPGKGWHYSNTNYLLLGMIAEKVGGTTLAHEYRSRFLEPLAMTTAFYQAVEIPRGPTAHGYRFRGTKPSLPAIDISDGTGIMPFRSVVTAAGGAGSVAASSADVARWAQGLYGGLVLSTADLALMLGDVGQTAKYHPRIPYGLGVQAVAVNGYRAYGHSGRLQGFQAVVRYLPDQRVTVAVLTNQSRSDPAIILRELLRVALPPPGACDSCPATP
ncbi:MAG TPA: serine hydrolase [Candidatus Limnocylindrales bacterium]|nr:serine hydrolase [Candidatus Limnocylindrales bacterium]